MKRILSIFMALLMLLGVATFGACADEPTDPLGNKPALAPTATPQAGEVLVAPVTKFKIRVGQELYYTDLLRGTTWDLKKLDIETIGGTDVLWHIFGVDEGSEYSHIIGFYGAHRGKTTIRVTAPDSAQVDIEVTVRFTARNVFQWLFMMGWLHMPRDGEIGAENFWLTLLLLPVLPLLWLFSLVWSKWL